MKAGDKLYYWNSIEDRAENKPARVAIFHAFGIDYEETGNGIGQFSTVIIERKDGTLDNCSLTFVSTKPNSGDA